MRGSHAVEASAGMETGARVAVPYNALLLTAIAAAVVGGVLGGLNAPPQSVFVAAGALLVGIIFFNPAAGAWTWLLVGPLVVGVARGGGLGILRPNEALLLILAVGIGLNALGRWSRRERVYPEVGAIDLAMLALVVTGSVMPVLLRYGRGLQLTSDDILYSLVFVKYFGLFVLFRMALRSDREVGISLRLTLISATVVAIVAVLQARNLFNVPGILTTISMTHLKVQAARTRPVRPRR